MKVKILMIDDNPDIVELIIPRMEAFGYEIATALSGEEGLEKAKNDHPDLILLDIAMPGMDGFAVGKKLKAEAATKSIPLVMVTAKGEHKDILQAVAEIGAADYVVKPFRPETLHEAIERVLAKHKKE